MKILAIETSCDETAISIIDTISKKDVTSFKVLGNEISSQIELHKEYGGVYPMMAKREHGINILSVLKKTLIQAKMYKVSNKDLYHESIKKKAYKILERENELLDRWNNNMDYLIKPKIDAIAVTVGPGLEPALWVGISFAKALSIYWNIPIISVNHMEGHIFSIFPKDKKSFKINTKENLFPMMSLLVSGGHTEIVLIKDWMKYKKIGQTRDDAVGEAFDKVARMLDLPYPGGPQISKLANICRQEKLINSEISKIKLSEKILLPRPMIYSKNYDFSFSGLKTAVLYLIRDLKKIDSNILENNKIKEKIAMEFENAAIETLTYKTIKAIKEYKINTLIIGGGVSANTYLQKFMKEELKRNKIKLKLHFPSAKLTGDNALMIGIAGYYQFKNSKIVKNINTLKAKGNMSL